MSYGVLISSYSSCTFKGGSYRYIAISDDHVMADTLEDYLGDCCDYYDKIRVSFLTFQIKPFMKKVYAISAILSADPK